MREPLSSCYFLFLRKISGGRGGPFRPISGVHRTELARRFAIPAPAAGRLSKASLHKLGGRLRLFSKRMDAST
jgi:hypothetical protein